MWWLEVEGLVGQVEEPTDIIVRRYMDSSQLGRNKITSSRA